jgi:hypothetical protein
VVAHAIATPDNLEKDVLFCHAAISRNLLLSHHAHCLCGLHLLDQNGIQSLANLCHHGPEHVFTVVSDYQIFSRLFNLSALCDTIGHLFFALRSGFAAI